jgi:predicted MFS family arabinose efflux permease
MAIGFVAIALFLPYQPKGTHATGITDPLKALKSPGLMTAASSAFFYNYAFFTVLAFAPFVLDMSPYTIGAIFCGWGVLLAVFSVLVAPRLQARFSSVALAMTCLLLFAVLLLVIAFGSPAWIIGSVVASGALMGINNTVYTEIALEVSPAPRPVASAGYNFVRWFAGVIAPYAAPLLAARFGTATTFTVSALAAVVATAILFIRRDTLGRFGRFETAPPTAMEIAEGETVA